MPTLGSTVFTHLGIHMRHTLILSLLLVSTSILFAEDTFKPAPRNKDYGWMSISLWKQKHEKNLARAKQGNADVVFFGDSITEGWGNNAPWKKHFEPIKSVNFGIGGDTTQNVLWRITNGELDGITPKVFVVMIGTNNFGLHNDKPADVANGVKAIVETLEKKAPAAKVLLLGVFPRGHKSDNHFRKLITPLNEEISKLQDGKKVVYKDIKDAFLDKDGNLPKELMPDFLHLSEKGYFVWAEAIEPTVKKMLAD